MMRVFFCPNVVYWPLVAVARRAPERRPMGKLPPKYEPDS